MLYHDPKRFSTLWTPFFSYSRFSTTPNPTLYYRMRSAGLLLLWLVQKGSLAPTEPWTEEAIPIGKVFSLLKTNENLPEHRGSLPLSDWHDSSVLCLCGFGRPRGRRNTGLWRNECTGTVKRKATADPGVTFSDTWSIAAENFSTLLWRHASIQTRRLSSTDQWGKIIRGRWSLSGFCRGFREKNRFSK